MKTTVGWKRIVFAGVCVALAGAASAHVFDDAKMLHFGLEDLPATLKKDTWYKAAPDYRHLSTWATGADTHNVQLEWDQSKINLVATNYDISTPTLARTLRNEPCFRINQSRVITNNLDGVSTSTNYPHGAVDFAGAVCSTNTAAWTVLMRFRPDMEGYARTNDTEWIRLFGLGWLNAKNSMLFGFSRIPGTIDAMGCHFLHGGKVVVPTGYGALKVYNKVWNEIAVIVDGNTLRVGVCNEKLNLFSDARIGPGQWAWNSKTYTFPEGCGFFPQPGYEAKLSIGRNATLPQLSAPRGDFHLVAFWDRPLSDHEVYEAFGAGHTPLVAVGGETNGFAAAAFLGDTTKDVTITDNRPTSWQQFPPKLVAGKKVTIPFTAEGWHMTDKPSNRNLAQAIRIPCDAATTAVGAQLKVTLDTTVLGTATMVAGKTNCELMIPKNLFAVGSHTLVLERTDAGTGDLIVNGVFAEGSWRIGDSDRYVNGSSTSAASFHQLVYSSSADYQGKPFYASGYSPTEKLPHEFDVLSGCWRDCSEFARNSWNNNPNKQPGIQQATSRVTFTIPDDLYDAGYRYRFRLWLFGAANSGKNKAGDYRCKYVVNGVTNVFGATSMTAKEFAFDISDRVVRGRNILEVVDDEVGQTFDAEGNWTWDNWYTQIRTWSMDIIRPRRGLMILFR